MKIENQELRKSFNIFIDNAKLVHDLHKELNEELRPAADLFESCRKGVEYICPVEENVGDIIVSKKHKFFMYAPFITLCLNLTDLIKAMRGKDDLRNEIDKLEIYMQEQMNQTGDRNFPVAIETLLMMPFQHILRYLYIKHLTLI